MNKPTPYQVIAAKFVLVEALDRPDFKKYQQAFLKAKAIHDPYRSFNGGAWCDAVIAIDGNVYGTFAESADRAKAILWDAGETL